MHERLAQLRQDQADAARAAFLGKHGVKDEAMQGQPYEPDGSIPVTRSIVPVAGAMQPNTGSELATIAKDGEPIGYLDEFTPDAVVVTAMEQRLRSINPEAQRTGLMGNVSDLVSPPGITRPSRPAPDAAPGDTNDVGDGSLSVASLLNTRGPGSAQLYDLMRQDVRNAARKRFPRMVDTDPASVVDDAAYDEAASEPPLLQDDSMSHPTAIEEPILLPPHLPDDKY